MKTQEQALTEWTTDEIRMDCGDGAGITRLYTRHAFTEIVASMKRNAYSQLNPTLPGDLQLIWSYVREFRRKAGDQLWTIPEANAWIDSLFTPQALIVYETLQEIADHIHKTTINLSCQPHFLSVKEGKGLSPFQKAIYDSQVGGQ